MNKRINFPKRDEFKAIHTAIISEYNTMLEANNNKGKMMILDKLAKKYGYSSGQAVRNMMNNKKILL